VRNYNKKYILFYYMDNTNNISQSIFQDSTPDYSMGDSSSTSSSGGFFSGMSITTLLLIILILAFLGFNIFVYLAQGTQTIADIFGPLVKMVFGTTLAVTGEVVDVSAEGAKKVVGGTANVIEKGLTAIQDITPNATIAPSKVKGEPVSQEPPIQQQDLSTLNRALNNAKNQQPVENDYQAYEASTSVHSAGKSGWCYIGQDRGFRSCAQVGANDTCMSGDIFPTHEICMNPNLRH
jgi:hypothetical protein